MGSATRGSAGVCLGAGGALQAGSGGSTALASSPSLQERGTVSEASFSASVVLPGELLGSALQREAAVGAAVSASKRCRRRGRRLGGRAAVTAPCTRQHPLAGLTCRSWATRGGSNRRGAPRPAPPACTGQCMGKERRQGVRVLVIAAGHMTARAPSHRAAASPFTRLASGRSYDLALPERDGLGAAGLLDRARAAGVACCRGERARVERQSVGSSGRRLGAAAVNAR